MSALIIDNHLINAPIVDILNQAKREIHNGKLSKIEQKGDSVRVTCPNSEHKNGCESHPSCDIYCGDGDLEYGRFNCFACKQKGSLAHFIALVFDETDEFGEEWLVQRFGDTYINPTLSLTDIVINKEKKEDVNVQLDESILDTFESYHPYMTQRKLSDEIIKKFEVKYDSNTRCIVMPVFDRNNKLIALTRRSVEGKKFIIDKNFDKSNLYCINKIDFSKPVYLVESQLNALTLWGYGKQALALFGCACSRKQIDKLNTLPIKQYILAFDNDSAGIDGTKKLCKYINNNKFVDVVLFNDSRDVNDISEEEFNSLQIVDRFYYLNKIIK